MNKSTSAILEEIQKERERRLSLTRRDHEAIGKARKRTLKLLEQF